MPELMVPPLALIYNDTLLSKKPLTAGLTEEDFTPISFVSLAINELGSCDLDTLTKAVCFATIGDVPDGLPSVNEEALAELSEAVEEDISMEDMVSAGDNFKASVMGEFLRTQGNPEEGENRMTWMILLYLGAVAIAEDKSRLAA